MYIYLILTNNSLYKKKIYKYIEKLDMLFFTNKKIIYYFDPNQ